MSTKYNDLNLLTSYLNNQLYNSNNNDFRSYRNYVKRLETIYDKNKFSSVHDECDEISTSLKKRTRIISNTTRFVLNGI